MDSPIKPDATPQSESSSAPRHFWSSWLFWSGTFLVVYLLGIGPAVKLHRRYPRTQPAIEIIYCPLKVLCKHCKPVDEAVDWYLQRVWHYDPFRG
jgi:hypothetical protein